MKKDLGKRSQEKVIEKRENEKLKETLENMRRLLAVSSKQKRTLETFEFLIRLMKCKLVLNCCFISLNIKLIELIAIYPFNVDANIVINKNFPNIRILRIKIHKSFKSTSYIVIQTTLAYIRTFRYTYFC